MPQPRNRAFGIVTLALVLGGGLFLLITPAVERNAHMSIVESGETDQFESSLRHLCWIRSGVEALDETVPGLDFQRKRDVLAAAESLGCITQLSPQLQATHGLMSGNVGTAIGFDEQAVEPAVEALREGDGEVREHASRVLVALRDRISVPQRAQIETIAEEMPASPARARLIVRLELNVTSPASIPPAVAPPQPADMGSAPEPAAGAEDESDAGEIEVKPGLVQPLREPTLKFDTSGVLFRADPDRRPAQTEPDTAVGTDAPDPASDEPAADTPEPPTDEPANLGITAEPAEEGVDD